MNVWMCEPSYSSKAGELKVDEIIDQCTIHSSFVDLSFLHICNMFICNLCNKLLGIIEFKVRLKIDEELLAAVEKTVCYMLCSMAFSL